MVKGRGPEVYHRPEYFPATDGKRGDTSQFDYALSNPGLCKWFHPERSKTERRREGPGQALLARIM
jgi:hypothetical protein